MYYLFKFISNLGTCLVVPHNQTFLCLPKELYHLTYEEDKVGLA